MKYTYGPKLDIMVAQGSILVRELVFGGMYVPFKCISSCACIWAIPLQFFKATQNLYSGVHVQTLNGGPGEAFEPPFDSKLFSKIVYGRIQAARAA